MEKNHILSDISYLMPDHVPDIAAPKWLEEDPRILEQRIQGILSDMAFKKSRIQEEMDAAYRRYLKNLEKGLRICFLKRFRCPMKLAKGEFIYFKTTADVDVYMYERHPFAAVIHEHGIESNNGRHSCNMSTRIEPIPEDGPLPTIIKGYTLKVEDQLRRYPCWYLSKIF